MPFFFFDSTFGTCRGSVARRNDALRTRSYTGGRRLIAVGVDPFLDQGSKRFFYFISGLGDLLTYSGLIRAAGADLGRN